MMTHPSESPLMKAPPGYYCCAICWYHRTVDGKDWCDRRKRRMRWNPVMFICGDYGAEDEPVPGRQLQTSLDQWRGG